MAYIEHVFGIDPSYLSGNYFSVYLNALFALSMLLGHFNRKTTQKLPMLQLMSLLAVGNLINLGFVSLIPQLHFFELLVFLGSYAIFLFIMLSESLIRGGAKQLTKTRGSNWTKELDYIYIGLAVVGLGVAIAGAGVTFEHMSPPLMIGWVALVTSFVLRIIKTRAEINGWNKSDVSATRLESSKQFLKDLRFSLLSAVVVGLVATLISTYIAFY